MVRGLVAGEEMVWQGTPLRLHATGEGTTIPLWIAAEGPRTLQLAGRIADAVVVENGATPSVVEHVRKYVAMGVEAAGRSPDDVDIWYMVRMRVDASVDTAFAAPGLEAYGASFVSEAWRVVRPNGGDPVDQLFEKKGIVVSRDVASRLEAFVGDAVPEFFSPRNVELLDKYRLRDWITETYFAFGTLDEVAGRVRALVDAGASKFMVPNFVPASPADVADVLARVPTSAEL